MLTGKRNSALQSRSDLGEQFHWNNNEIHLFRMHLEWNLIEVNHKNYSRLSLTDIRKNKAYIYIACSWVLKDVKMDGCVWVYCILVQLQREVTFSVSKPDDSFQIQPRTQNHVYKTTTIVTGLFITT